MDGNAVRSVMNSLSSTCRCVSSSELESSSGICAIILTDLRGFEPDGYVGDRGLVSDIVEDDWIYVVDDATESEEMKR